MLGFLEGHLKQINPFSQLKVPKFLYRGKGCPACNFTGYRGRCGIYETLNINEEIRKLIISPDFSLDSLNNQAKKDGMMTIFEDGLRKVATGVTTVEEVLRVIRE